MSSGEVKGVRVALMLFLLVFLGACATMPASMPPQDGTPKAGEDAGYLLVSIGSRIRGKHASPFGRVTLMYNKRGLAKPEKDGYYPDEAVGWLSYVDSAFDSKSFPYVDRNKQVEVIQVPLIPGDYEISKLGMYHSTGQYELTVRSPKIFSLPFEIKAGEVTYLGEFIAESVLGKNVFGLPVYTGGLLIRSDEMQRDYRVATEVLVPPLPKLKASKADLSEEYRPLIVNERNE